MPAKNTKAAVNGLKSFYDTVMAILEPDLMTNKVSMLDALYEDESPEAHEARMRRYERAFERFEKVASSLGMMLMEESKKQGASKKILSGKREKSEQEHMLEALDTMLDSPGSDA